MKATVEAVVEHGAARLFPVPGAPGRFVGLRVAEPGDVVVHEIPDGPSFAVDVAVELELTRDVRKALERGDLKLAAAKVAPTRSTRADKE